jgi:competence protein ComEC
MVADSSLDLEADVLKVGHHGSKTSTSDAFLSAATPSDAVISVGAGNTYGHPTEGALNRLTATGLLLGGLVVGGLVLARRRVAGGPR